MDEHFEQNWYYRTAKGLYRIGHNIQWQQFYQYINLNEISY